MIFKLEKASDYNYRETVRIDTFDELLTFVSQHGRIIFELEDFIESKPRITIYNDYVE